MRAWPRALWLTNGLVLAALCGPLGCGSSEASAPLGSSLRMDLGATADLFAAPFPSDHLVGADGTVAVDAFPNPDAIPLVEQLLDTVHGRARGFATTATLFFTAEAALDAQSLPALLETVEPDASVQLLSIDPASDDYLQRYPLKVHFESDGGPFGAANMLALLPLQGIPLRPHGHYAAVVLDGVRTAAGEPLVPAAELADLLAGKRPDGLSDAALASYRRAVEALDEAGIARDRVVGLSAFHTWDPTSEQDLLVAQARALATPSPVLPFAAAEIFDDYCVFESTVDMPVYQTGEPPYQDEGGEIPFEPSGPQVDHPETARIVVTIPRAPMPAGGWPSVVMIRTGGGGDRPLVDRGPRDAAGEALAAGTGPAWHFARAGWAGVSVDGPHGGLRNITGGDEQFLIFNLANPVAMRDNLRQSALELALLPDVLATLELDVSSCPDAGAPTARFDVDRLAIMGHSMGATIAPLTLATEPRYRAALLSGAGGSWIENVIYKRSPLAVKPLAEVLLHYPTHERQLHEHDPVLALLQWAGEPADPPVYAPRVVSRPEPDAPRHILMMQGIVDTYILPPIANALSLSLGLDRGGQALDAASPELSELDPLDLLLPLVGRGAIDLPASGNRGAATALVVQHPEDGIEDGHEVVFQTEPPQHQMRCFLSSLLAGAATVTPPGPLSAACE